MTDWDFPFAVGDRISGVDLTTGGSINITAIGEDVFLGRIYGCPDWKPDGSEISMNKAPYGYGSGARWTLIESAKADPGDREMARIADLKNEIFASDAQSMARLTGDQELRRWAVEQAVAVGPRIAYTYITGFADELIAYVRGEQ